MKTGTVISGTGHGALILWLILGDVFTAEPLPFDLETTDVTLVSAEEFSFMTASNAAPQAETDVADVAPPAQDTAPEAAQVSEAAPQQIPLPASEAPAPPDTSPELAALAPPPPELPEPEAVPETVEAPLSPVEVEAPIDPNRLPSPDAAPRVAPEAAPEPFPDARPDTIIREETIAEADRPAETPEEETTAPEEASTEIVTEADQPAAAPRAAPRPQSRPERPVETAAATPPAPEAPETPPEPAEDSLADAIAAAVSEAVGSTPAQAAPASIGVPITQGERDALRIQIGRCWNLGSASTAALRTVVVVLVDMLPDGKPANIQLVASDGDDAATRIAFDAARRAIIRCGVEGYDMPPEKYEGWKQIEITFNPETMRQR